jgi:hypothetical protein
MLFEIGVACLASLAVIARADVEANRDQAEECDIGSSLHLLQKSATVLKQQNLVMVNLNQSLRQSTQVSVNSVVVYTIHDLAEKIKQAQLEQPMNPFVHTPLLSVAAVGVSVPVVTTSMSWYNYVVSGVVAFSLLCLIWTAVGPCCVFKEQKHCDNEVGEEEDEGESEEDFEVAKYLGFFLSITDGNDWMIYTFFPTWLVANGLSFEQALLTLAWNGIGILIGVPTAYYMIPLVEGGPPMFVWIQNRLYALTRVFFIALILVPTAILLYFACLCCFLAGVCVCMNEVAAQSWCILSVDSGKRIKAMGFLNGGRMLGTILGPGIGGVLYSLGGLCLPFAVGFILLVAAQEYGKPMFLKGSLHHLEKRDHTGKGMSDASNSSKPVGMQGNTGKGKPQSFLLRLPHCLALGCYFTICNKHAEGETLRDKQLDPGNGESHGPHLSKPSEDKMVTGGVKSGSILFNFPILICLLATAVMWTCLISLIEWQQIWMSAQYGLATWEYGLYFTCLMIALSLWIFIGVINVTKIMTATSAMILGALVMGSGYVLVDSPLIPFISHTTVWTGMFGTLICMLGVASQLVVTAAFIPNYAIGCGWEAEDAAVQSAAFGVAMLGLGCFLGPGVAGVLVKNIGVPSMCSAFAIVCFGTAVILSPLYSVQSTAGEMRDLQ